MKCTYWRTLGVAFLYLLVSGHVGSPDTWFEGNAGPYHLVIQIQPAGVVPGVAVVNVQASGDVPDAVTIQANKFDATGGAPPPEPAPRVEGAAATFSGRLWIMSGGSNSVTVTASGKKGTGKVVVPIVVVAYSRLRLDKPMGAGLAAMGVFLFVGLVTIMGAAVREGSLSPGESPTPALRKRARTAMAITTVVAIGLLAGGWSWWNSADRDYARGMYKPLVSRASLARHNGQSAIQIAIQDSAWIHRNDSAWLSRRDVSSWTPLVEDHGKIMHLFLIRDDMGAFAHLHPETHDSVVFSSSAPPLPSGKYKVFADIVHESGFTQTLVSSLEVAGSPLPTAMDNPDDSWFTGAATSDARVALPSGTSVEWQRGQSIVAGKPADLKFIVRKADGSPASLEPYMGMAAHAVVAKDDGSVFVHLHPMGTISMASQMAFAMREPGDTIRGKLGARLSAAEMSSMQHAPVTLGEVSFPYAFPIDGSYHIWVQVKLDGKIETAAFSVPVSAAAVPPG